MTARQQLLLQSEINILSVSLAHVKALLRLWRESPNQIIQRVVYALEDTLALIPDEIEKRGGELYSVLDFYAHHYDNGEKAREMLKHYKRTEIHE